MEIGGSSLNTPKTGSEVGTVRRKIDVVGGDKDEKSKGKRCSSSVGDWRRGKDTGSGDNWEMVNRTEEMTGERHWDDQR